MNVVQNKTDFVKYKTVFDLFKILYNICKMLNEQNYLDYCYCNQKKSQCWVCKFSDYIKYNNLKNQLLRYRENESKMLDLADKFWFYIRKIKKDVEQFNVIGLNFFDEFNNNNNC